MPAPRSAALFAVCYWTVAVPLAFGLGQRFSAVEGLRATVYDSLDWQGPPKLTLVDATLSNELLGTPPIRSWQSYSVRWDGYLAVLEPADYGFQLSSDDGSMLEVDGHLVVDNGGQHLERAASGSIRLSAGMHRLGLRYFQAGGRYKLNLLWSRDGGPLVPIPSSQLLPDAMSFDWYRVRWIRPFVVTAVSLLGFAGVFAALWPLMRRLTNGPSTAVVRLLAALERQGPALAVLLVVGLLVRLAVLFTTPPVLWPDTAVFSQTVDEILAGKWGSHDAYRTVAYPYFLALFARLDGKTLEAAAAVAALQQVFGLASAALFYLAGRRVVPPLVAFAGTLLFVVHGLQLFYEMSLLTESLFTLMLALTLWLAVRAYEMPAPGRAAALGLAAATLVLVRPVAQYFIVVLLLAGGLALPRSRQRLIAGLVVLCCYAVPVMTWMSVNQREYGFFGVALGRGMGLYTRVFSIDGLVPPSSSAYPDMRELWAWTTALRWSPNRVRDFLNYERRLSSAQADDLMFVFSRETALAHPLAFMAGTVRQFVVQIAAPPDGVHACPSPAGRVLCSGRADGDLPPFPTLIGPGGARLRRVVVRYVTDGQVRMKPVAALAAVGLLALLVRRRRDAATILLGLTVLYFVAVPALTQHAQDRFRLPVDALLFMLAAHGVSQWAVWMAQLGERWRGVTLESGADRRAAGATS